MEHVSNNCGREVFKKRACVLRRKLKRAGSRTVKSTQNTSKHIIAVIDVYAYQIYLPLFIISGKRILSDWWVPAKGKFKHLLEE